MCFPGDGVTGLKQARCAMEEWVKEWIVLNLNAESTHILEVRKEGSVTARRTSLGWDLMVNYLKGYQRWLITKEFLKELKSSGD